MQTPSSNGYYDTVTPIPSLTGSTAITNVSMTAQNQQMLLQQQQQQQYGMSSQQRNPFEKKDKYFEVRILFLPCSLRDSIHLGMLIIVPFPFPFPSPSVIFYLSPFAFPSSNPLYFQTAPALPSQHILFFRHPQINQKHYQKLCQIGRGGSSRVYKAFNDRKEIVAIKKVSLDQLDPEAVRNYQNEIDLLKKLRGHDKVIRLDDEETKVDGRGRGKAIWVVSL
jgi:hypothetical protein